MTKPPLPKDYYLHYFRDVTVAAQTRHLSLLNDHERCYLSQLDRLSKPALMLYARLVNRKGPCFRLDKLVYPEIGDLTAPVQELLSSNLITSCDDLLPPHRRERFFACFTHKELTAGLRNLVPKSVTKSQFLEWLTAWDGYDAWLLAFQKQFVVIRIADNDPWPFLRFLFFGELRANLSDFVVRELGFIASETIPAAAFRPHFSTRQEADDAFRLAGLYETFRALRQKETAATVYRWWLNERIDRASLHAGHERFDRLVDRLGRLLERSGHLPEAAELYATSPVAPARERLTRLWMKMGRTSDALALLALMQHEPCHEEECFAAEQLQARITKASKLSAPRHHQKASATLILPYDEGAVEHAVLTHYRAQGWHGIHSENWLWNAAFGLLLWDIIYDSSYGSFHSPLQYAPSDLHGAGFYSRRRIAIDDRLSQLRSLKIARNIVKTHWHEKQGLANPFVSWHPDLPDMIETLLAYVPGQALALVLQRIAKDTKRHSRGFPDLFLWNGTRYRFCEIKAENDHLSAHQYQWLRFMEEAGIAVSLENVKRPVLLAGATR